MHLHALEMRAMSVVTDCILPPFSRSWNSADTHLLKLWEEAKRTAVHVTLLCDLH